MIHEARIRSATPGSYMAKLGGCSCDCRDNHFGTSLDVGKSWAIEPSCEMHGTPERWANLPHRVINTGSQIEYVR